MTEPIFIFRVRPDGHVEEPDCWRITHNDFDDDVFIHREPGESNESLRARTIQAAGPGPRIILHSEKKQ